MDPLDNCFATRVLEPVKIVDVLPASGNAAPGQSTHQLHRFKDAEELEFFLTEPSNNQYTCRYISICQRTSWSPLQVTRPMLDLLVSRHEISSSFYELPSCFYSRSIELEAAFCVPFTHTRNGDWIESSYTLRYPEFKEGDEDEDEEDEWVIRQSGVYHRFNTATLQNLFVLFNPNPNTVADQKIQGLLLDHYQEASKKGPLWLHDVFLSTHLPAWRRYIASLERELLPIANSTMASYIDEPLRLGYDNLSTLVSLEKRFLKVLALIATAADVLEELTALDGASQLPSSVQNHRRHCKGCERTATFLLEQTRTTAQLLADTLALRDQVIAKEQGASMLQLNKSAVFITTLTLVYLPPSFVATFFGMNFFDMDQNTSRIVGTSMVWIYVAASAVLMSVTFAFYYWLLQEHDSSVFRRLAPKARVSADWRAPLQGLKRRLSSVTTGPRSGNPPPPGVQLRTLSV